jgi:hypothetical protein
MKPSDFTERPWDSVLQKGEPETVARNIMVILKRTDDTWRPLDWEEYKEERLRDGGFSPTEKRYFDQVIGYCKSVDTARLFSPVWARIAEAG